MAIPLPGEGSPLYETWVMLLHGYGYNFYRKDNQARADDLLVRQSAGHFIGEAAKKLQLVESEYQRRHLPQATREHPFPPPEPLATHRAIRELRQQVLGLEAELRGMPAPPDDKTWMRHRNQLDTLKKLLVHDVQFVGAAKLLDEQAALVRADSAKMEAPLQGVREHLELLRGLMEERRRMLLIPLGSL